MSRLIRDGVALAYSAEGSGSPAIVLIHGWTCDRTHFAPQAEWFKVRHLAVSIDLRGHGESDATGGDYSIGLFADDAAWLVGQLGIREVVAVGHSMGGLVAVDMAARYPELVKAVAAIDSRLPRLTEADRQAFADFANELADPLKHEAVRRRRVAAMFELYSSPSIVAAVTATMLSTARHSAVSAMRAIAAWDSRTAFATLMAPLLNVETRRPHNPVWAEVMPAAFHGRTVGAGHFAQLEVPDQVNAMLQRFMDVAFTAR